MIFKTILIATAAFAFVSVYGAPVQDASNSDYADVITNAGSVVQNMNGPHSTNNAKGRVYSSGSASNEPLFIESPIEGGAKGDASIGEDGKDLIDFSNVPNYPFSAFSAINQDLMEPGSKDFKSQTAQ